MSAAPIARAPLYSPELLALATGLADFPLDPALPLHAEARSRTCGSTIAIGFALGDGGFIERVGMQVSACAIGQASAALLARGCRAATTEHTARITDGLKLWLAGERDLPDWPGLAALVPARAHPGRHAALLLPWKAACLALSSEATGG